MVGPAWVGVENWRVAATTQRRSVASRGTGGEVKCRVLTAYCWVLGAGCWVLSAGCSMLQGRAPRRMAGGKGGGLCGRNGSCRGPTFAMMIFAFTALIGLGAFGAGLLGALTGLGGGVVIVPLLTLVFHVDIRYAVGASLVSVIATSSGAAAAYVREGYTNIRVGMLLEVATTVGALVGAALAAVIAPSVIAVIFGLVLLYSAYQSSRSRGEHLVSGAPDPIAARLRLDSTFPTPEGLRAYQVRRVPAGFGLMGVAGVLSGLLGIGSGAVKVLAMDQAMCLPFKVSTTTSNFMIGVTAAASAGIYLRRGYIDPGLAMPVMLGVLAGATVGARVLAGAKPRVLRLVFAGVVVVLAVEMIYNGVTGRL